MSILSPIFDWRFDVNRSLPYGCTCSRPGVATAPLGNKLAVPVAANMPRFTDAGLIVEAGVTQYVRTDINSLAVGTVDPPAYAGAQAGTCVVSQDVYAPIGDRVLKHVYLGTGYTNVAAQALSALPAGATLTASVWLWIPSAAAAGTLTLTLEDGGGVLPGAIRSDADWSIRDRWQRASITATLGAGKTGCAVILRSTCTTPIYSCGWQMVGAGGVSSYITPDSAAPVTRNTDVLTIADITGWMPPSGGGLYVEYMASAVDMAGYRRVIDAREGLTADSQIFLGHEGQARIYAEATQHRVNTLYSGYGAYTTGLIRAALRWQDGQAQMAVNGVVLPLDASVRWPTVNQLTIGGSPSAAPDQALNGVIRRITILPGGLTDADMATLTTSGLPVPTRGRLGDQILTANTPTWLYTAPAHGSSPITCNLRVSDAANTSPLYTVWVTSARYPLAADVITPAKPLVEDAGIVLGPGESVWVMSTDAGCTARLHGM